VPSRGKQSGGNSGGNSLRHLWAYVTQQSATYAGELLRLTRCMSPPRSLTLFPPTASYPSPTFTRGMSMDNAIVSGTLFTLMAIGVVVAGIALMMM
jgi:hypothetical protein